MDDGGADRSGYIFHTNNFTHTEVELLISVLKANFDLDCTKHKAKGNKPLIYVTSGSASKFKSLVEPYVIPHFAYKLVLRGSAAK